MAGWAPILFAAFWSLTAASWLCSLAAVKASLAASCRPPRLAALTTRLQLKSLSQVMKFSTPRVGDGLLCSSLTCRLNRHLSNVSRQGKLATIWKTSTNCNSNDGHHQLSSTAPLVWRVRGRVKAIDMTAVACENWLVTAACSPSSILHNRTL